MCFDIVVVEVLRADKFLFTNEAQEELATLIFMPFGCVVNGHYAGVCSKFASFVRAGPFDLDFVVVVLRWVGKGFIASKKVARGGAFLIVVDFAFLEG